MPSHSDFSASTPSSLRDLFAIDPDVVFLNHGSFGACPREVLEAQWRWQLEMERNPVEFLGRRSAALLYRARTVLATELETRAENLVFIPNSTTGVNIVAQSLTLEPGDEVLATNLEYGACDATWQRFCDRQGARYRHVDIPLPFESHHVVERIMAEVTPRTRLIFASHITSTTALILPVAELCATARARGILTLIDGAHAPGQIPLSLDSIGADFYVGNCHKWLCAPKGSGFLHAAGDQQDRLDASVISWGYAEHSGGHSGFDAYLGNTPFERKMQWQGTRDLSAWLAVPDAIEFLKRHRWAEVRRRCHQLASQALLEISGHHGLSPIACDEDWAQMVAIPVPAAAPELLRQRLFNEHRIEVPVTTHAHAVFVRLSVQGYNTEEDVYTLVQALCALQ
ncbi:MAG: aminotransferase class V-fold PLP-dependent enzyme [Betaproteobacteria bacterium]